MSLGFGFGCIFFSWLLLRWETKIWNNLEINIILFLLKWDWSRWERSLKGEGAFFLSFFLSFLYVYPLCKLNLHAILMNLYFFPDLQQDMRNYSPFMQSDSLEYSDLKDTGNGRCIHIYLFVFFNLKFLMILVRNIGQFRWQSREYVPKYRR